jgi:hypothetical protein
MSQRKKHPSKEIEAAVQYAESRGWRYKRAGSSGHGWGRLLCPSQSREGCVMPIWSTPSDADNHVKQILSRINSCPHGK